MDSENKKKRDPRTILIIVLAVVALTAVALAVWAIFFRNTSPVEEEPHLAPAAEQEESLTDRIALPQFAQLNVKADTKEQELTFDNPARNFAHFRVSIVLDDEILWESELLAPGETSQPVVFSRPLEAGEYEIELCYACFSDEREENPLNGARSPVKLVVE